MIGSGATQVTYILGQGHTHTASDSVFWWQVHISSSGKPGQTALSPQTAGWGPAPHICRTRGPRPPSGEFKAGALKNLHWRCLSLVFPQCDKLSSLTGPKGEHLPFETYGTQPRTTRCFQSCRGRFKPLPLCSTGETSGEDQGFSFAEHSNSLEEKVKITSKPPERTKTTRGIYEESIYESVQSQRR